MAIAGSIDFSSGVRKANMNGVLERSAVDRLPVFATLPQEARASLVAESTVRHYARKSTLVVEGAVPGHVFVVLQGRIRAVRRSESGREVTLETYQPGDVLVDAFAAPGRALMKAVAAVSSELFAGGRNQPVSQLGWTGLVVAPSATVLLARPCSAVSPELSTILRAMRFMTPAFG